MSLLAVLHEFGMLWYLTNRSSPKGERCVMLGFVHSHPGDICWVRNMETNIVFCSGISLGNLVGNLIGDMEMTRRGTSRLRLRTVRRTVLAPEEILQEPQLEES